jgi:putative FmdB family regulatory protein
MPIYDYRCPACDESFERLIDAGEDRDAIACPKCQNPRSQRLLSRFAGHSGGAKNGGMATQSAHTCGSPSCCRLPR